MTQDAEILFHTNGRAGVVTLNRPKALNALTRGMVASLQAALAAWARDPAIAAVVIRGAGEKAFCAGGDIRQLHAWGKAGDRAALEFYREEYRLNSFIKRYPKPFVALIDGIVMGGGVGVSFHGSHRVAGERLAFAMPETGIGLFPDVGGTFFLPRLPGRTGTWLALTGARLGRADTLWCGLATHAIPAGAFDELVAAVGDDVADVDAALSSFSRAPEKESALPALQPVIDRCFGHNSVEAIVAALDAEAGEHAEWARGQAATIRAKSPTSLKIALRQMQDGASASFEDCMRMEFRIVSRVIEGHDFYEGVRAVILDKDNDPHWRPARLEEVDAGAIDAYFAPLETELDLHGIEAG